MLILAKVVDHSSSNTRSQTFHVLARINNKMLTDRTTKRPLLTRKQTEFVPLLLCSYLLCLLLMSLWNNNALHTSNNKEKVRAKERWGQRERLFLTNAPAFLTSERGLFVSLSLSETMREKKKRASETRR